MNSKAQLSIEFLLVLTAMLGFISVFAGAFAELENSSLFVLDARNAKRFAVDIEQASKTLMLLGDGSEKHFEYKILNEWEITSSGGKPVVIVSSLDGREISISLPENLVLQGVERTFVGEISVSLKKSEGRLILANADF